jgi:hypothetical protein
MQKLLQPPACSDHGLHRILSSYCLAHFQLMKKSAKVQLYFGSDCGMMVFFTDEPQSKEQLMSLPHFWNKVRRKRSRFEHMQTANRTKAGSLKKNTTLEYSTRVVQEGDRRCEKSTLNDLAYLTPLRIPLMNPVQVGGLEAFLHEAAQNFEVVLNIQN